MSELTNEAREFVTMGADLNTIEADRLLVELCNALDAAEEKNARVEVLVESLTYDFNSYHSMPVSNLNGKRAALGLTAGQEGEGDE